MRKLLFLVSFLVTAGVFAQCAELLKADIDANPSLGTRIADNPELINAWKAVGKHDDLRTNTKFLENIAGYSDDLLKQLDDDLLNPKWADELKNLFKESPDDVTNVWKQLKDDPSYAWEISKTGDSRWQKWSQREFFKDVTSLGKKFEAETVLRTLKDRSSQWYGSLKSKVSQDFGKNLDDYDMFSQVQLKYNGDNYFVADQVFVKYKTNALGQKSIDDIIVIENKLRPSTQLTTPQTRALSKSSYTVRNAVDKVSEFGTSNTLKQNNALNFDGQIKWYKVYDSDNGDVITGIDKL